jgi:hypothetical protein
LKKIAIFLQDGSIQTLFYFPKNVESIFIALLLERKKNLTKKATTVGFTAEALSHFKVFEVFRIKLNS